ncbi:MAG: thioredoxin family protein [Gammaproteobacteria bacterium]|nr:thioredoxin family protein [Gammaproteobacteria bacterium]
MTSSKIIKLGDYHKGYKPLDQFTFHHILSEAPGTSVILFWKKSCSSCAYWRKLLLEFQQQNRNIRLFDVDVELDPGLAEEHEIFHLPAIYVYRDGDYYGEVQCEAHLGNLQECLNRALSQPPQEMP